MEAEPRSFTCKHICQLDLKGLADYRSLSSVSVYLVKRIKQACYKLTKLSSINPACFISAPSLLVLCCFVYELHTFWGLSCCLFTQNICKISNKVVQIVPVQTFSKCVFFVQDTFYSAFMPFHLGTFFVLVLERYTIYMLEGHSPA